MQLWDALPTVPIPLQEPDEPVALDLQMAIAAAYDEAGYDLSIDYAIAPPPPELNEAELNWWNDR